jgi:hypothetical protein
MSGIFTDLSFFGGLVNTNIRANINTPLNLTQGARPVPSGAPSPAPMVPFLVGIAGTTSITIQFSHAGITGTAPISYIGKFSSSPTKGYVICRVNTTEGDDTVSTVQNLTPDTTYYFKAVATNAYGNSESSWADFSTAKPS